MMLTGSLPKSHQWQWKLNDGKFSVWYSYAELYISEWDWKWENATIVLLDGKRNQHLNLRSIAVLDALEQAQLKMIKYITTLTIKSDV